MTIIYAVQRDRYAVCLSLQIDLFTLQGVYLLAVFLFTIELLSLFPEIFRSDSQSKQ